MIHASCGFCNRANFISLKELLKTVTYPTPRYKRLAEELTIRKYRVHGHCTTHSSSPLYRGGGFSCSVLLLSLHAFMLPRFRPVLTSLRLAQQQHKLSWIIQANIAVPAAIHMNANISMPMEASMFNCSTLVTASCMIMNWNALQLERFDGSFITFGLTMTVAMIAAAVMKSAFRNVKIIRGRDAQRL